MGREPSCVIAYGWLVDGQVLDELTDAWNPQSQQDLESFPDEIWGYYEEVHAIGWEKKTIYCTEEIEGLDLSITADDLTKLKLFREWLVTNQHDWSEETEEVFKLIMTTSPKLLAICNYL